MRNRFAVLAPAVIAALAVGACNDATSPELNERPSFNGSGSDTPCVGALPPGTYQNVVVPAGETCIVNGSTILGNLIALENSNLEAVNNNIRGNVELLGVTGGSVHDNPTIGGNVFAEKFKATGFILIFFNPNISGNLIVKDGSTSVMDIAGNRLPEGKIEIQKTIASVLFVGECCANILDKGGIKVEENTIGLGGLFGNNNQVAQDFQVFKNKGPGAKWVMGNAVGGNLQCFENDPPFEGGPNAARKAEGQCMAGLPFPGLPFP